jgi:transposase
MSRTSKAHYIAMDTHGKTTTICVKTRVDSPGVTTTVETSIAAIRGVIERVERPRKLTFEEGPLADWLLRNLQDHVEETVVCDPRKNALIAKDSDKDDPIDAGKLCDLFLGKYLKPVHHPESRQRAVIKQVVGLYLQQVRVKVRAANQAIAYCKRWGVVVQESGFATAPARALLMCRMPEDQTVQGIMDILFAGYDHSVQQVRQLRCELKRYAKEQEVVERWCEVPGIGPVRGMVLWSYLDTPWRFKSKQALWKYMGIGLVKKTSGEGLVKVGVEKTCNRHLKNAILGAAESAIMRKDNPYRQRFEQWMRAGIHRRNSRRNVARALACTVVGMWKNGGVYDPGKVFGGGGP